MAASRRLVVTLVVCLLGDVFSLPFESRLRRGAVDNEVDSADQILGEASPAKDVADSVATATAPGAELSNKNEDLNEAPPPPEVIQDIFGVPSEDTPSDPSATLPSITEIKYEDAKNQYEASPAPASDEDDDDDDDAFEFESMETSPTLGVGSNIFSLLSLANSLFGGSSGGGEDGQSDLGSLLAAVSGIVVNLSGDGIDVNALIASGIGLFVGLLSEGEENPGAVIASYLLTSLETFTGGGADNNGKFFGKFLSTLIKGTSKAAPAPTEAPSILQSIWNLKLDIIRALFSASTGILGAASASSSG